MEVTVVGPEFEKSTHRNQQRQRAHYLYLQFKHLAYLRVVLCSGPPLATKDCRE